MGGSYVTAELILHILPVTSFLEAFQTSSSFLIIDVDGGLGNKKCQKISITLLPWTGRTEKQIIKKLWSVWIFVLPIARIYANTTIRRRARWCSWLSAKKIPYIYVYIYFANY